MKTLVLGDLEQEILSVIWSTNKSLSVREVLNQLSGKHAYTTVMTVMNRLEKKGILKRIAEGKSFVYTYTENKTEYANKHLNTIYQSIMDTYGELAITQFVDSIKSDKRNIKLLEKFLKKND